MVNGQLSDSASEWIGGLILVVGILALFAGFYIQMKKIKVDAKAENKAEIDKAVIEAKKETASEIAFNELKKSVDNMSVLLNSIADGLNKRVEKIECDTKENVKWLAQIDASATSAHKRMDEHRNLDHGINVTPANGM